MADDDSDHGQADLEIDPPGAADDPGAAPPSEITDMRDSGPGAVPRPRARLVAFGAGRGGTGRSLIAANIAIYLAQTGKKVVAIDADAAGGPLHQLLGAPRPARGFGEFLRGRVARFGELLVDTPVAGVSLLGGEGAAFG